MSVESLTLLVDEVQRLRLLEPSQLTELTESLQRRFPNARDLARELARREWVSPFQLHRVLQGRGPELLIGPYVVLDRLDDGVIGPLFKARHENLKRVVAIQVVREEWFARSDAMARFHHDWHAASKLTHRHIARVFDVGQMGRVHYFVLEPLEGLHLDRMVCQFGPLPIERACLFVRQAALGLQYVFERGLWHHDLKPSNLFVTSPTSRSGQPMFDDFADTLPESDSFCDAVVKIRNLGLTSLYLAAAAAEASTPSEREDTGAVKSEDCLAPEEKLASYPSGVRANLYSLGCTLYYLLSGRVPFPGGGAREKQARHRTEDPIPVERLRPETPPEVGALLRRLMAKRPEDRYQTPAEAADALAAVLGLTGNSVGGCDAATPGGSTAELPTPAVSAVNPETPGEPIAKPAPEPCVSLAEDEIGARHRRCVETQKPRQTHRVVIGGGVLLASLLAAAIVLVLQFRATPAAASVPPPAVETETPAGSSSAARTH
jgi:serine/threonine-protein kinase